MENSNFDELLKRYLTGELTPAEQVKIEAWLDAMKTGNKDDLELTKGDEERLFQKITSASNNIKEIQSFVPLKRKRRWLLSVVLSITAVVIIAATFIYFKVTSNKYAAVPHKEKLILSDGTLVWMQKDSKVTYDERADQGTRHAVLQGEALFEVAKDPDHPFIIECNGVTVQVVGTSFSLKANDQEVVLKVFTGKVKLSTRWDTVALVVLPNQEVRLTQDRQVLRRALSDDDEILATEGTQYRMDFTDTALEEVLQKLEKKFDVSFSLENAGARSCRITANLTDQSLQRSLQILQDILDIKFDVKGNTIAAKGNGC